MTPSVQQLCLPAAIPLYSENMTANRALKLKPRHLVVVAVVASLAIPRLGRAQYQPDGSNNSREVPFLAPKPVFFPPTPPPLDRAISHLTSPAPRRLTPPPELATYVNEPFYAPLSTWLAEHTLNAKLRQRLDAYRSDKLALQRELHAVLDQARAADPAARRTALEASARQQAARLAALEQTAEQLRDDLAIGGYDWRAAREWTLGERNSRGDSPSEIASVMRAYAYYQSSLSGAQRRLLREISLEIAMAAEDEKAAQAAQPFLFFPPEPARVLLPEDLTSDLAAKVAAYQTKKSAVKKELFDTVYKQDGATFSFVRQSALKALAEKQANRLAELERLAEEIRIGLAQLPPEAQRPAERSPLPPVLTERIAAVLQGRTTLTRETTAKMESIRDRHATAPLQISYGFESDGLKFIVVPRRYPGGGNPPKSVTDEVSVIQAEMAVVAEEYGRRFTELVNETDAIRDETSKILGSTNPRAIEVAMGTATRVVALRETEEGYRDYRTAVFEPGLSPEQRRLLFDGAIEKLDLPLSRGEMQPTRRAPSW